jgi:hypothetical protein
MTITLRQSEINLVLAGLRKLSLGELVDGEVDLVNLVKFMDRIRIEVEQAKGVSNGNA